MADFDYQKKESPKLSEEFKNKFTVSIKGTPAIKLEGLTAVAHEKGMWKFETSIIQYPNDSNGWTAICETVVGGYDYDPIAKKIREVTYKDIGDANVNNCGKLVAPSYIRMASTRSQARALRKYTNIDMLCSSEMTDNVIDDVSLQEPTVDTSLLISIRNLLPEKNINQQKFGEIMFSTFGHTDVNILTQSQGNTLFNIISNYVSE